ncbi:hypothetical protein [Bacillus sp. ISL-45]|uniref:hypothetical protein n=1 Tax=Bacillus sp. ISL-45 TaxID=2819128 RepID=UPI001BE59672|nr:hypothetical protein [Bacillus sp. ISL-45]
MRLIWQTKVLTGLVVKGAKLSEVGATSDKFGDKREKLSEVRVTSDRFGGEREKGVRTSTNFGQGQRKKKKSCQNQKNLRLSWQKFNNFQSD